MKVLLPEKTELTGFERQLQETLEQANLAGIALMGFAFREARSGRLHEIDALLLMEPGILVCLEAKGYSGKWTGSANQKWKSGENEIQAIGTNPYKQVTTYSYVIKDRLKNEIFNGIEFYVSGFVVAPDSADIEIQNAVVDQFQTGRTVLVCRLSKLEAVLAGMFVSERMQPLTARVKEIGLEQIASTLVNVPVDQLGQLMTSNRLHPEKLMDVAPVANDIQEPVQEPTPTPPQHAEPVLPDLDAEVQPPEPATSNDVTLPFKPDVAQPRTDDSEPVAPDQNVVQEPKRSGNRFRPISIAAGVIGLGIVLSGTAAAQFFWSNRPCEVSTETRINETCYKDLARTPLRVGILADPEQYAKFKTYLKEQLGARVLDVVIEGSADIKYAEAQNKIAKKEWDLVFALSPMNSMRAKDNGYRWVARMFPENPPTYQSALFVKANSPIQSLDDIKTTTRIALGDVSSASSFYMPTYDLYGKSMTVSTGHRSRKIRDLVASGMADMGAAVYSSIKDDPQFRVIHVSRALPGSGVYISPKISVPDQETIQQILLNAPEEIRKAANYGADQEPDYEPFRTISLRADEVLSCSNFEQQPVRFFCDAKPHSASVSSPASEEVRGTISGFTNQGNGIVNLRFKTADGKTCQLSVALKTLSSIPNGTSPGIINQKEISLSGVDLKTLSSQRCHLMITNPAQLTVLR